MVYQLRLSASSEMAESGQQPTVDATLVNDIFEMLMEMDIRKIDTGAGSVQAKSVGPADWEYEDAGWR